jgi:hypothetical protein
MAVANLVLKVSGQMADLEKDLQRTSTLLGDFGKQFQATSTKAAKAQEDLNRSFSGEKIISQAAGVVTAVEKIGGASKLTATEMDRVNRIVTEAIGKFNTLGHEAPPAMQALADATKRVEQEIAKVPSQTGTAIGALKSIAGAVGIGFSVAAVVNFGKSVVDAASEIHDISEQLGISTDAVQGFKFAAEQSGSSLDAVSTALTKMNQHLAEGDKSTVQALRDAGLQFSSIRNLAPEDAFLAIADAIQQIPDPMKQSQVALALFGKGAASLLPGIKEGFRDAAKGADKMSSDTIKSLEAAQDAWERFGNKVTIVTGNILAQALKLGDKASLGARILGLTGKGDIGDFIKLAEELAHTSQGGPEKPPPPPAGPRGVTDEEAAAIEKHAQAIRDLADAMTATNLTNKAKDLAEALALIQRQGKATPDTLKRIADEAGDLFLKGGKLPPVLFDLALGFGTFAPKVVDGAEGLQGLGLKAELVVPKLSALDDAIQDLTAHTKLGADGLSGLGEKVGDGFDEGAKKIQDALRQSKHDLDEFANAFHTLGGAIGGDIGNVVEGIGAIIAAIKDAHTATMDFIAAWGKMSSLQRASTLIGGAGAVIGATGSGSTLSRTAKGAAIGTQILPGYGTAIGAGIGAIRGALATPGRDVVKDFAASFGGFEDLHKQLNTLGKEGEQLWINLTQGVGQNNSKQAQAAVKAVTDALQRGPTGVDAIAHATYATTTQLHDAAVKAVEVWKYVKDSGEFSAAAVQDAWEKAHSAIAAAGDGAADSLTTATKAAQDQLDAITGKLKSLTDSIANEAPEEVMGVIEQNTRAQIKALEAQQTAAQQNLDSLAKNSTDNFDAYLKEIDGRKVTIDVGWNVDPLDLAGLLGKIPAMAAGGIVRRPTLALIGEHGPEAVTPLNGQQLGMTGAIQVTSVVQVDGYEIGRATAKHMPDVLRDMGVRP